METVHKESSFATTGRIYRVAILAVLIFALTARVSAQSADDSATASANQQPSATVQSSPVAASAQAKPATPAKPKKVITNEDLDGRSNNQPRKAADGDSGSWLSCEASCEQQARDEAGYGSEREAEWQMQVVNARRELAADTVWRQLLMEAIQQSNTYCNFMSQQSQKVSPNGNGYQARVQRAKSDQYFQNMDNVLRQKLQALANQMTQHTNEVGALSPVRGAMMYVQGTRILQRTCQFPPPQ